MVATCFFVINHNRWSLLGASHTPIHTVAISAGCTATCLHGLFITLMISWHVVVIVITGATALIITTVIISLVASSHAIGRLFVAIVLHTIMRTVLGSSVVVAIGVMVLAVAIVHQVLASIGRRCAAAIIVVATCVAC